MSPIGKLFRRKKDGPGPGSFWQWFSANHKRFQHLQELNADKAHEKLDEIVEKLKEYNPWFKALIGKYDDTTNELVITADGDIALFVKVEELISKAPDLPGWRFISHKPAVGFEEVSIEMYGRAFNEQTVKFFPIVDPAYPDMVSISFVHKDYNQQDHDEFEVANAIYIQNALGEINVATLLDHYEVSGPPEDLSELIPVTKLPDYLNWRQKEFVEKYDNSEMEFPDDTFNTIEGEDADGNIMMAIAVSSYQDWAYKPAFPWLVAVQMEYPETDNGLPDEPTLQQLHDTEDSIISLITRDLHSLYAASKTYKGCRTTYFYSKNYKDPSTLLHHFLDGYEGVITVSFFIERDKYWQNTEEFFGMPEAEEGEEEDDE
jgi:hypothetical protein